MAASTNLGNTGTSWSKWQMALLVGAPVIVGVGYWYMKKCRKCNRDVSKDPKFNNTTNEHLGGVAQGNSSKPNNKLSEGSKDSSVAPTQNLTPFEISQVHKDMGNALFKKQQYKEAIQRYTLAINTCPKENRMDLSKFYQNRAAAREHLELYDEAWSDCSQAIELNPKYVKALQRRAKISEKKLNLEQSLEDLTAACILEGYQNQTTILSTDRVLKELGRKQAKEFMSTRFPALPNDEFILSYFSAFSEDPVFVTEIAETEKEGGFSRAKTAFLAQNFKDVIDACNDEINATQGNYKMEACVLKATFDFLSGAFTHAIHDLNIVIEDTEAPPKVRVNGLVKRAFLYLQLEEVEKGFHDYELAINIDPDNPDIYYHRGQVYLLMDNMEQALENFDRVVALRPALPLAWVQKGYADYRYAVLMQNPDKVNKAIKAFKDIMKRFPEYPKCYTVYAEVLLDQQRFEEADTFFTKALELEPGNASIHVYRGTLRLQWTGDFVKAKQMIKEAIKSDSTCLHAYETLGTIAVQEGNLLEAIELFNKAIPLAKSETECIQLFTLRDAAAAQYKVAPKMGIYLNGVS